MSSHTPARTALSAAAAALCLAVSWIHVQDQGGFPGDKEPGYVGAGYYLLEVAGVVGAALLLAGGPRGRRGPWLLAAAVALGPLVGYVLSRGPGLPDYGDDRGNWSEPLGLVSIAVEVALLATAAAVLLRNRGGAARNAVAESPGD
jgi:hypothetical protein